MIVKGKDMKGKVNAHMRDGKGEVEQLFILDETNMAKHSRLFSFMNLKPGCSIGEHTHHNETEYYYILAGSGFVVEKDGVKRVEKGDVVITGNNESHSIENDGPDDLSFIAIIILD